MPPTASVFMLLLLQIAVLWLQSEFMSSVGSTVSQGRFSDRSAIWTIDAWLQGGKLWLGSGEGRKVRLYSP